MPLADAACWHFTIHPRLTYDKPGGTVIVWQVRHHSGGIALTFITIDWCSPEYQQAIDLRHRLLREPLGMKFSADDLDGEMSDRHFGWLDGDRLVAIVLASPIDSQTVKLRQMAVETDRQGTGLGRQLLLNVEAVLRESLISEIYLHAREHALGFYESCGYEQVGEPFIELGLPHQKMVKTLSS